MYLQMYWLMAASSDPTRCEHCGLLISPARPIPKAESAGGTKGSATMLADRPITGI